MSGEEVFTLNLNIMNKFESLQPQMVWQFFDEITRVPRASKKEEKILAYLIDVAQKYGIDYTQDTKGNLVMRKAATEGYQGLEGVILQSHVDMVCEKESAVDHNFDHDPIDTYIDKGWVRAQGTTLGADCGIGMALQLAVMVDNSLAHPSIEALFTVDEEQGLTGAAELGADMLTGGLMINLDSEDEGEIFIGCAGGVDTVAQFDFRLEPIDGDFVFFDLDVRSLVGGHSGDDINKGRANANKLIARLIRALQIEFDARLSIIDGGNLRNAIARESQAVVGVLRSVVPQAKVLVQRMADELKQEFAITEPSMDIEFVESGSRPTGFVDNQVARKLIESLNGVSNGVIAMSESMPGLVETSTNLASVKMAKSTIEVVTSQRSSVNSAKLATAGSVESVFTLAGAEVRHTDGYPGWAPNPTSPFVGRATTLYNSMFAPRQAKVKAIHAGLECGLFLTKFPKLDIISIGPTLRDVHSPTERLEIETVQMTWRYLIALLAQRW